MSTHEKLTEEDRDELFEANYRVCSKALRIIDQLTAALEAAERESASRLAAWQADLKLSDKEHADLVRIADEKRELQVRAEALQARVAELEAESARLRSSEAQYRERVSVEESKRYQSEKLLRKTAQRLESLHQAADAVCRVRERAPDATLHDIRVSVSTLRDVLSRPNLVSPLATAAEAELADLRGRVAKAIRCLRARGLVNRIECALEALRGR